MRPRRREPIAGSRDDADLEDAPRAYHGANYDRLLRVNATYDPDGFFEFERSPRAPA
jgi:hypothetical protein